MLNVANIRQGVEISCPSCKVVIDNFHPTCPNYLTMVKGDIKGVSLIMTCS